MKKVLILMALVSGASIFGFFTRLSSTKLPICTKTGLSVPLCKANQKPNVSCEHTVPSGESCNCPLVNCYTQ